MNSTRIWAIGTVLVIGAVLALGWLLGVSPTLARLAAAEQELANTEATNQAQSATLEVMRAQFEDIDELRDELEVLRIAIPGTIDSDFVYALLNGYQGGIGTAVDSITTGEPQPYGLNSDGTTTVEGVSAIPNLFTVPVTVTFKDTPIDQVMRFVGSLQRGPRLFLVTSVSSSAGEGESAGQTATITAYMFVLADPNATAEDAALALAEHGFDTALALVPLGDRRDATGDDEGEEGTEAEPTPDPTGTPTPEPSATPEVTPTP